MKRETLVFNLNVMVLKVLMFYVLSLSILVMLLISPDRLSSVKGAWWHTGRMSYSKLRGP